VPRPSTRSSGGPYSAKVGDSRAGAQIGFGGWFADFPSVTGLLPPILSCDAFIPESPLNNNLAEFGNPAIDEKMSRATELQAQDPPAATLLWQDVERDLLAHAPVVPVVNRRHVDFVSERAGNYQYNPQLGAAPVSALGQVAASRPRPRAAP
jgi:peptide/nickel transport system substrate-binding protein